MIKEYEEVKKDWNISEWDDLLSIQHILGDKYESVKDYIDDLIKGSYGAGFNDGFIDARHNWYKYAHIVRNHLMTFYKDTLQRGVTTDDVFNFVTNLISLDIDDIIMNKDK